MGHIFNVIRLDFTVGMPMALLVRLRLHNPGSQERP